MNEIDIVRDISHRFTASGHRIHAHRVHGDELLCATAYDS